jgi:hypothetical protein
MKGSKNTIIINGRLYDAVSGMPIAHTAGHSQPKPSVKTPRTAGQPQKLQRAFSDVAPARKATPPSHAVHKQPQKSQTLNRAAIKRPAVVTAAKQPPKPAATPISRSPAITKFGTNRQQSMAVKTTGEAPKIHPAVTKALHTLKERQVPVKPATVRSSKELKELLIKERLSEVETVDQPKHKKGLRGILKHPRLATILTSTLAILLLGGYLTYINLPNISMRVASTRAGIAASFPGYKPDGYSFQGPITYAPGEVAINFKSNTNNHSFTVRQTASNWDSQAVLDNHVLKQTPSYLTYQERGLTIYSFDNEAAWVNGGVLYSIEGNAQLSGEQILRIATSM